MGTDLERRRFPQLAGATAVVAACGGATSTAPTPSTGASATPKATGTISIYSALNESTNNELFKAFTSATGVNVQVLPLAAVDGDYEAVLVAPPHAARTAVTPASYRNLRRSSSGVIQPLPRTLPPILRA